MVLSDQRAEMNYIIKGKGKGTFNAHSKVKRT